jgi:DNA repair protein RadC
VERLLRETRESEQPLARLERLGPAALSTTELLQLLLDAKTDPVLPLRLTATWRSLNEMAQSSPLDLLRVEGMTRVRSARLRAALELGKRAVTEPREETPTIRAPSDAAQLLAPEMAGLSQEQMRVMMLNTKNRVTGITTVYQGSIHTTLIRVTELFREAVRQNSAAIIVAHNHPSGDPTPSPEDVAVTREIVQAGKILDIDVLDHLVLGDATHWVSLKERGLGFA